MAITKLELEQRLGRALDEIHELKVKNARLTAQIQTQVHGESVNLALSAGRLALLGHTVMIKDGHVVRVPTTQQRRV